MTNKNTYHLRDLSCLQLTGPDAGPFLHSQLTIGVLDLASGESRLGAYCDVKGRVISSLTLSLSKGTYYLIVPSVLAAKISKLLSFYTMRAKVEINKTENLQLFGVSSANNTATVQIPHPLDEQRSFALLNPTNQEHADLKQWQLADINCKMVWLDQKTSLKQLPQFLGMVDNGAVDFTKGCYPGQEIIARLKYLGKVKYALYKVSAQLHREEPTGEQVIRDSQGNKHGQLLNHVIIDSNLHGLAVVRKAATDSATALFWCTDAGKKISQNLKISA